MLKVILCMGMATAGNIGEALNVQRAEAAHPLPRLVPEEHAWHSIQALTSVDARDRSAAQELLMKRALSYDEFVHVAHARFHNDPDTRRRAGEIFAHHRGRFAENLAAYGAQLEKKIVPSVGTEMPWSDGIPYDFVFPEYFRNGRGDKGRNVSSLYLAKGVGMNIPCDCVKYTNYSAYTQILIKDLARDMAEHFLGREDLITAEIARFRTMLDDAAKNNDDYSFQYGQPLRERWKAEPPLEKKKTSQREHRTQDRS